MKKNRPTLCFLLADGFEDIEFVTTHDILKRAGFNIFLYSADNLPTVESAYGLKFIVDNVIVDFDISEFDGLVIPGGPAVNKLNNYYDVHEIVNAFNQEKKLIAAICAAPLILDSSGLLKDRKFTCYPEVRAEIKEGNYCEQAAVVDQNIITSRGPATASDFAFAIVEYFFSKKMVEQIKQDILLKK